VTTVDLKGRNAVVTGASRGIGRAIATAFAQAGATVAVVSTRLESSEDTRRAIEDLGGKAHAFACDVSRSDSVQALADAVQKALGQVDIVVNNAGITRDGLVMRMSEADWDAVLDTNLKGAFHVVKAFSKSLLRSKHGRVINVASVVGLAGNAGQANYAASKGGLIALTKSLAKELGSRGITVNALAPGYVETDMTAALGPEQRDQMVKATVLGRAGTPSDVAGAALYLASDLGSYVTGQVLAIDGGLRL
jgi:3-oxoacyl-[acyl-carrier protein] reductase